MRNIKDNKKSIYCCISSKRLNKGNVGVLLNEVGNLVTVYTDKAEILTVFFA